MLPDLWRQRYREFFGQFGAQIKRGLSPAGIRPWSHAQLIEVAAVALEQHGPEALEKLREQLERIGPGYHETLTGCWLELIGLARASHWTADQISQRLSFSQLPFAFYSLERLNSAEARLSHLSPDLKALTLPPALPADLCATLVAFQSRQLAKEDWTHCCHLRVAAAVYMLLGEPGRHVMATGIQRLNEAHGVPLTPTGGYHETLTRLWFHLVARAVDSTGLAQEPASAKRMEQMLRCLEDKKLPLRYYSRERMMSWEARIGWLEPDLQSLESVDFV